MSIAKVLYQALLLWNDDLGMGKYGIASENVRHRGWEYPVILKK